MIRNHMLAFLLGFLLDLILGDPHWMPHPIRLIGKLIEKLEKRLNCKNRHRALKNGCTMVVLVIVATFVCTLIPMLLAYGVGSLLFEGINWLGVVVETILTYYLLATKCLRVESMKVYEALKQKNVIDARKAVSMIVGRDTDLLGDIGITKAAVETVAENTSDGIIAPMLYTAIGGPVLGFVYKAINTMDSMIGYKNEKYLYFGRTAAKVDDVANFLPSRISAYLMMAACLILKPFFMKKKGETDLFSVKNAFRIHRRDRRRHASPNSAQTESTCAGALGIQLAGDASYFGEIHHKPFIGDYQRTVEYEDIKRANYLLYGTAILCEILCLAVMCLFL